MTKYLLLILAIFTFGCEHKVKKKRIYHVVCEDPYFKGTASRAHVGDYGTVIHTENHRYEYPPSIKCEIVITN